MCRSDRTPRRRSWGSRGWLRRATLAKGSRYSPCRRSVGTASGKAPMARSASPASRRASSGRLSSGRARRRRCGPLASRCCISAGTVWIMPTSVTRMANSRSELAGSNSRVEARNSSEAASKLRRGSSSSAALGVGRMERPTRTSRGSPKWLLSRRRILLTEGCPRFRVSAARVRLPTSSSRTRTLRSVRLMSSRAMAVIPYWHPDYARTGMAFKSRRL